MDHIDAQHLHQVKVVFALYDKAANGYVHVEDLSTILRILGFNPTMAQIQDVERVAIASGRGNRIDFPLFLELITHHFTLGQDLSQELERAFLVFDHKGTGLVAASELRHVLTTLGDILPHHEVDRILNEIGADVNGDVDYKVLIKAITAAFGESAAANGEQQQTNEEQTATPIVQQM